ncbi:MAG TPA: 2-amino-4-hydroxy-6-hydroxymethyldihydropteridine diphosphokinase, partial [Gammaproteobacteria bacterium]
MARVYVSIGSNIERDANIRGGVSDLQHCFGVVELSRVYESEAVGFDGDNFYNLVAAFDTDEDVLTVAKTLHDIENDHGRTREGPRFSSRTLDIDMLLY